MDEYVEIDETMEWYFDAFSVISESRQFNKSIPSRVQLSEIKSYLDMFDCAGTVSLFVKVIQGIDRAYVDRYAKDIDTAKKQAI